MAGSTPHQLDQIVADLNIHLEMGRDGHSKHFTTFQEMKDFFVKEKEFWSNHTSRAFTPILHLFSHVVVNLQQAEKLETEAEDARSRIDGTVRIVQNGRLKAVISSTPAFTPILHLFSHVVVNLQQAEKLETEAEDARSRIDGTVRIVQNGRPRDRPAPRSKLSVVPRVTKVIC